MKLNKIVSLSMVAVITSSLLAGCSNKSNEDDSSNGDTIKIGMVADVGGINDESFNQSAWEGLQKAKEDFGVEIQVIESKQASEYLTNMESLIEDEVDLVIGVGNTMKDDIEAEANNYPEQQFVIIDETYEEIPSNVTPLLFKENEAAYITGLIAGKMTKTNNVGFIGGMDNNIIQRFQYGYMSGVKESNPEAKVSVQYAGTFGDAAKGKSLANQMYGNDVDIILSAAGGTGLGAIEAAKEKGKYAIGVDKDQSSLAVDSVLTSALKKVNVGVYDVVKELVDGQLTGGEERVYGLKEDGVGIPESTKNLVPQEIIEYVNEMIEKIKSGEVQVPVNKEEYDALEK